MISFINLLILLLVGFANSSPITERGVTIAHTAAFTAACQALRKVSLKNTKFKDLRFKASGSIALVKALGDTESNRVHFGTDVDFYTLFPNALGQSIDSLKSEILLLKAEVTKIDRRFQMDSEQGMMWFTPPNANRVQVDFTKFGDPSDIELKRPHDDFVEAATVPDDCDSLYPEATKLLARQFPLVLLRPQLENMEKVNSNEESQKRFLEKVEEGISDTILLANFVKKSGAAFDTPDKEVYLSPKFQKDVVKNHNSVLKNLKGLPQEVQTEGSTLLLLIAEIQKREESEAQSIPGAPVKNSARPNKNDRGPLFKGSSSNS